MTGRGYASIWGWGFDREPSLDRQRNPVGGQGPGRVLPPAPNFSPLEPSCMFPRFRIAVGGIPRRGYVGQPYPYIRAGYIRPIADRP